MSKMAKEEELVEWVEGKPYSRAADADRDMRCNGGDNGLGMHIMSFITPLKKTPLASMWVNLL